MPAAARAAIVRVENARGGLRAFGTGTLVDIDGRRGWILTCAHVFRDGAGTIHVGFPNGSRHAAQLVRIDAAADLAALAIDAAPAAPIEVAAGFPQRGEPLISCGYGTDGRLWCNRGAALGYVTSDGSRRAETLELSGSARFGDSGGPVFNREYQLVAVLFGTNGRVVDATFCGRVRKFMHGLSPRFSGERAPQPVPSPAVDGAPPPLVQVPQAPGAAGPDKSALDPESSHRLARLEGMVGRLHDAWQTIGAKVDRLGEAVRTIKDALPMANGGAQQQNKLPGSADPLAPFVDSAKPWLSAKLAALLVSFGVPGGIAGVAAGAIVYFAMRRGKRRLQAELARVKERAGATTSADEALPGVEISALPASPVVRHHNRYVPYEITALDKAWSAAHAQVGEKYPGAVPYLKIAEGVKDQLLSGNTESTSSERGNS
ncbi:MAG: serine protease [Pirellulales bacterium]